MTEDGHDVRLEERRLPLNPRPLLRRLWGKTGKLTPSGGGLSLYADRRLLPIEILSHNGNANWTIANILDDPHQITDWSILQCCSDVLSKIENVIFRFS